MATARETTTSPSSDNNVFTRGRVRLNEAEAILLVDTLHREIDRLLDARGDMIDAGVEEGKAVYNTMIASARRILDEIERTAQEKGWADAIAVIAEYGSVAG